MARDKKFGGRKNLKCPIPGCGQTFKAPRYLHQHMKVHNNNNNNNNNNYNKNYLKKFIKFIIRIILLINEDIENLNYIGDKNDQRRAIYNLKNDVPDKNFIKKTIIIDEGANTPNLNGLVEEMAKDPQFLYNEIKNKEIEKEKEKKEKEEKEYKEYMGIINYISQFEGKNKKNTELAGIKIKRNIIREIKEKRKEEIIKLVENKIEEKTENEKGAKIDIDNRIELGPKEEPLIDYEADFLYPKISARQLFEQTIPDKKIKKWVINYINKIYIDYPTDNEIKEEFPMAYDHYTRVLSGNGFYKKKFDELQGKILEYIQNGGESFKCSDCNKYVLNLRRHCMHCKEFLKKIDEEKGQIKLKEYLEKNYKKIKIGEIDAILKHFEGKKSDFISENLPHYIKFQHGQRKKLSEFLKKKREKNEKNEKEAGYIPPVQFNTGLGRKLFEEINKDVEAHMKKFFKKNKKLKKKNQK